jgi:hypothetical protein
MYILPAQAVSTDLKGWQLIAAGAILFGKNPYTTYALLKYFPFWWEVLAVLTWISDRFNWPFYTCVRGFLIVGEMALITCVFFLCRMLDGPGKSRRTLLWGLALNPLLITLTIQHGNFDSQATIWVALFLILIIRFRRGGEMVDWLLAAACLGIGIFVKTFPFVLIPLLAPGARRANWRLRILAAGLILGPAALSVGPLLALSPVEVWNYLVLNPGGVGGFGMSGLLMLTGNVEQINPIYALFFRYAFPIALVILAIALWRRDVVEDRGVVMLSSLLLFLPMLLGPRYGPQYWFWVVPLWVALYPGESAAYKTAFWIAMVAVIGCSLMEYAFCEDLGQFFFWWHPTGWSDRLADWFSVLQNTAKIGLVMTVSVIPMAAVSLSILRRRWLGVGSDSTRDMGW